MIFRILNTDPRLVQCVRCFATERAWNDRTVSRWKSAHTANCPSTTRTSHQENR